ncbi:MAG TPA: hypothetical protein VKA23_02215 [Mariprofundaceae bacterium]|nr:hypothetical protein [Mariprofundaceae bacterium]
MEAAMTLMRKAGFHCDRMHLQSALGVVLIGVLSLPHSRAALESSLIHHMLIQIPLLVLSGWLVGKGVVDRISVTSLKRWNERGVAGLIVALFGMLFWMIPRWLDASLSEPLWEVIKFVSIPLMIGLPLAISWPHLSSFARAVVWSNAISMLLFIGWLYVSAPVRVCNNYLVNQQEEFGYTAMVLSLLIAIYWVGRLFFGRWEEPEKH